MSKDKVTRINKDRTGPAKLGQFKNLINAAKAGQISVVEAQKAIRKLVQAKKGGGKVQAEFRMGGKVDISNFKGQF
tara:strand:- start:21 stop:248 length:228 start_codon:yes stop_codon:yes gene_type:complete